MIDEDHDQARQASSLNAPEAHSAGEAACGDPPAPNAPDPLGEFPSNVTDYLFYLLVAVARLRDTQLEPGLQLLGLGLVRYRVLAVVGHVGACTMSELATFSSIDRTTLTRAIDQLLESGLVERLKNERDRRVVRVAITPAGETLRARAEAFVSQHGHYLLADIPEELQRQFVRLEQALVGRLAPDAAAARSILDFRLPDTAPPEPDLG